MAEWERLHAQDHKGTKRGLGFMQGEEEGGTNAAASVASHYNSLHDRHRTLTAGSDLIHLRNLHNWIKSVLIGKYMQQNDAVLDLACGKGGDLLKFKVGRCGRYVGIDIAQQSVRDAVMRYNGASGRAPMPFPAEFYAGDFSGTDLDEKLPRDMHFNLVSCQFALHYSFGTEARATQLLRNVASRLLPGGFFVATLPDANVLVRRLREAKELKYGNSIYSVQFDERHASKRFPTNEPFGVSYNFYLNESVENCAEYLVPLPVLSRLAASHGLELVEYCNFTDFFSREWKQNLDLLERMSVLPNDDSISEQEWEVSHAYMVVAFRKKGERVASQLPRPVHRPFHENQIIFLDGADGKDQQKSVKDQEEARLRRGGEDMMPEGKRIRTQ
ncbi:hypothetical protein AB1Y20_000315 [Prymnesium parvum]|uniref:mRNA (guanine-N(7))-methyltransferase n=1 Tax=Prymnesium parvum TaxID=97485 RepID=A0AB34K847_PRYPA